MDWLELGLKTLATDGAEAIRIDKLCAKAKRTKGSFYHHFKTRDGFVSALVEMWANQLTQHVIEMTEKENTPISKLVALNKTTSELAFDLERELRKWAGSENIVRQGIKAIDQRRIDYVASLLMQAKNITSQQAIDLAVMNYTSLIGFQQMFSNSPI